MHRQFALMSFWIIFCAAWAAPGCRSAALAPPILQVQESTGTTFGAAASPAQDRSFRETLAREKTVGSGKLVLCSGDAPFQDSDDEPVIPSSFSADAADEELQANRIPIDAVCDPTFTFRSDLSEAGSMLWDDTKALFEWRNAAIVGAGLGGALAIRSTLDGDVRAATLNHADRWGGGSEFLSDLGSAYVQWPAWFGLYAYSLHTGDEELHNVSRSLFSSLAITGVSTTVIKVIANTDRPSTEFDNGHYGFPSYHTASSFAIAGVIDEYYGLRAGLPAYAVAGLIGWSRIDLRAHDLSDVVFGAVLGAVIGKSVAHFHRTGDGRFHVSPWYEPSTNSSGVMMEMTFD